MKTLLEYLTKLIVKNPAEVRVVEEPTPEWTVLHLTVAPSDMGLAIGKGGKIISALRNLVRVKAIKEGKRVHLQLVETPAP